MKVKVFLTINILEIVFQNEAPIKGSVVYLQFFFLLSPPSLNPHSFISSEPHQTELFKLPVNVRRATLQPPANDEPHGLQVLIPWTAEQGASTLALMMMDIDDAPMHPWISGDFCWLWQQLTILDHPC